MEFRILGPLEVLSEGHVLELGRQKQRALLAVLLLHANEVVSSDRLIEAIWEERPPETAAKAVQVYVSQLRKLIGKERLQTKAPGYLLRVEPDELDSERFRRLGEDGKLREALALWRGPPLAEFGYQRFAQVEIARLEELRLACLEERIEHDLADGRHAELVGELESLTAEHPLRERLRGQLMLAMYRSGRQAEALDAYQEARDALVEELGIEPSRELRERHQAILNQDPALDLTASAGRETTTAGAFVGREAELEELMAGLDDAFAGRGRLFLLVGEPGIGKSRLADELSFQARARGARVLVGRCWEAGGAPAYWPWVQSMRLYVRETPPELLRPQLGAGAAALATLLPELHELFPDVGEPLELESESARFRLFEAASDFLKRIAQTCPLVLVLDDLHAADEPSLLLLRFLARELGAGRMLVVGACRNVDPTPTHALTAALTELGRERVARTLALHGLSADDVRRFMELVSGEEPSDELVATIHEDTEGNPLFVGEIVRLLATEGHLDEAHARRLTIPQSVRDVIARRLGHLSGECNRVLVLACVLGREFSLAALARMAGISENQLLETLDEPMEAGVVADLPGSAARLRFAHVLIRDTLYESLTTARRVRLHRLAVEALEETTGTDFAELAYHSIAGSDFERAHAYATQAGDRALALLAYEEAARLYETALEALELTAPDREEERCDLLLALADAQFRAGESSAARATFLDAAAIARRLGLVRRLARAAIGYGGRIVWARSSRDDRLVPLLEEALAALGDSDAELRIMLLSRLAGALRDEPSRRRRDALSNEAVDLARRTGEPAALAYALDARAHAIIAPDTVRECLTLSSELREVAAQTADKERLLAAHMLRIHAQLIVGDLRDAETNVMTAVRIADALRQPAQRWLLTTNRAMLSLATGRLAPAEGLMDDALTLGMRAQPEHAIQHDRLQRYTLGIFRGDIRGVEPGLRDLADAYPARPVFRCAHANAQARSGQLTGAGETVDDLALDGFSALPFDQEWLYAIGLLAETCVLLHDESTALALRTLAAPYGTLNAVDVAEGFMGSMSRYLGLLATTLGSLDDAARHFEEAIAMNQRMGARPWLAYTQHDYGRLLTARNAPGDRQRAQALIGEAHATYEELGMQAPVAP
jgi:DNA-binding SARP family transcriptional activator